MLLLHISPTTILHYLTLITLITSTTALTPNFLHHAQPPSKRQILYPFESCFARWQIVSATQTPISARVTTTNWAQTPEEVTSTINNFYNIPSTNIRLWRQGGLSTLLYCGFFYCSSVISGLPQPGLNGDNVVASLILPSGVAKLMRVGPYQGGLEGANAGVTGIFGVALRDEGDPLVPADYAYVKNVYSDGTGWKKTIQDYVVAYRAYQGSGVGKPELPIYVSAVTGDGRTVVISISEILV